ncbi:hypothetical protein LTR85_006992 [Meristemomyces frigidus]|nr:hypothetical protein LTR85_006992 [Meristemomyces frigidus]
MAEDIEVLEQYLPAQNMARGCATKPYSLISNAPGKSVIYLTVPRRRKGLRSTTDPGSAQREILEQILGPLKSEVIRVYFEFVHPCFPVLDEIAFNEFWEPDPARIPSSLICEILASTLLFWHNSPVLKQHPRPDLSFAWNQAVTALQEDFMAPTVATVHSALIDMVGRPILQMTGNIVNAGRTASLAHSLGLHRDPTTWKAAEHEKAVRVRLWWGCVVNDHW